MQICSAVCFSDLDEGGGPAIDKRAVIIINAQSVIQITNNLVYDVLGYTKHELKGKPLKVILPPAIADAHQAYVRSYINTGERTECVLALRRCKRMHIS